MAVSKMSKSAMKAYKKAVKAKKKAKRGHWLLIQKGDSVKEICSKLFTQFAVLVLIGCGAILGNELLQSISAQSSAIKWKNLYDSVVAAVTEGEMLPGATELVNINPDTCGYICIDGTAVDFPVVQSGNNDDYLKKAFDGSYNKAGTVFLDYRATLGPKSRSDNLTLYGHNQRDRTMFGSLKDYKKNLDHYKNHPTITFSSNYHRDVYKIFAYFVTEVEPRQTADGYVFDYHNYIDLSDREVYGRFISNINERSQIVTAVDVEYGDEFLTLSTCSNEFEPSRFVVFARKTRKGEDEAVDVSAAYLNPNAKEPDWSVIY
ncbi:MAG: class B sortase [Oscillospiraceae bacterium]|nr:class B sortase [Oscillospiraceae bacterium]